MDVACEQLKNGSTVAALRPTQYAVSGGFRAADTARLDTSTFVNRFDHYAAPLFVAHGPCQ